MDPNWRSWELLFPQEMDRKTSKLRCCWRVCLMKILKVWMIRWFEETSVKGILMFFSRLSCRGLGVWNCHWWESSKKPGVHVIRRIPSCVFGCFCWWCFKSHSTPKISKTNNLIKLLCLGEGPFFQTKKTRWPMKRWTCGIQVWNLEKIDLLLVSDSNPGKLTNSSPKKELFP